jgi:hypothetical protein
MEALLLRIQICHYNLKHTNNNSKKENILNNLIDLVKDLRPMIELFNYFYNIDLCFSEYLEEHKFDYLKLLSYDLESIAKEMNIGDRYILTNTNGKFKIIDKNKELYIPKIEYVDNSLENMNVEDIMNLPTSLSWADN